MSANSSSGIIDITGLDKAELLIQLWINSKKPIGKKQLKYPTIDNARMKLEQDMYVDCFYGRSINVNFNSNKIMSYMYDLNTRSGKFQKVVDNMKSPNYKYSDDIVKSNDMCEFTPLDVAISAYKTGLLGSDGEDQVSAMKDFAEGKLTYSEMRDRCG